MHDPHDLPFQRKCKKLFFQRLQIIFFLGGGYHMDQDLTTCNTSSKKKMSKIPHMLQLFIEAGITLQEKLPHTDQDLRHIRMDQLTVIRIQDIVSASLFVKSKG